MKSEIPEREQWSVRLPQRRQMPAISFRTFALRTFLLLKNTPCDGWYTSRWTGCKSNRIQDKSHGSERNGIPLQSAVQFCESRGFRARRLSRWMPFTSRAFRNATYFLRRCLYEKRKFPNLSFLDKSVHTIVTCAWFIRLLYIFITYFLKFIIFCFNLDSCDIIIRER